MTDGVYNKEECPLLARKSKLNSPTTTQLTILVDLSGSCKFCIGKFGSVS